MLWHAMPPELNTARLMAGAGPAPMLAAAAGWQTLSAALDAQAVELTARLNSLGEAWTGGGSDKALAAATPMVVWLQTASTQAKTRAMQATAQAAAYTQAMATTPSLPEIAANHITQAVLTATNFFGINTIPIALTEMDYFIRMWNQAALAMEVYQAETAVNTLFEKLEPMASILDPGASQSTTNPIFGMPSPGSSTPVGQLPPAATQTLGQLGEMSGPMQQLTQPLQQVTSLFSQVGGTGGGSSGSSAMDAYDLHSGNGNNLSGYANAQIDGIISALAVSADPAERARLLAEAAPVLWDEMPTLPLYRQQRTLLMSTKMYAVSRNPTRWGAGWNMDRWALAR